MVGKISIGRMETTTVHYKCTIFFSNHSILLIVMASFALKQLFLSALISCYFIILLLKVLRQQYSEQLFAMGEQIAVLEARLNSESKTHNEYLSVGLTNIMTQYSFNSRVNLYNIMFLNLVLTVVLIFNL